MNALGYSAHHIVSHSHRGAASVRAHLRRLGFTAADLDKAYNGAWLKGGKGSYHAGLHTTKYFKELEKRLLPLGNKADVIDELGNIAWELMDGTFPH